MDSNENIVVVIVCQYRNVRKRTPLQHRRDLILGGERGRDLILWGEGSGTEILFFGGGQVMFKISICMLKIFWA